MSEEKKTGEPVRDMNQGELSPAKPTTENKPVPKGKKEVQIHAGNISVVQTQILSDMSASLAVIAGVCRIWLKENTPKKEPANG